MMPGSKIVLPSSNAEEYSGGILRGTISRIVNPKGQSNRNFFTRDNSPSWWPKDVAFSNLDSITAVNQRKILATFFEKCPQQYTISPRVDQQNSASEDETDQPEDPAVGTKRARMMPGSKIVLPSSDVEEYSGNILQTIISHIGNPKGMILFSYKLCEFLVGQSGGRNAYASYNRPSWWPKDVVFSCLKGPTGATNSITAVHQRKILAAFLEKCPEQYTISPPVGQQNSAILKGVRTKSSKIVLPSSNADKYCGLYLRRTVSHIANPKGRKGKGGFYTSDNHPSWWPKDVAFVPSDYISAVNQRKVVAAFLEKCSEQYTISPRVDQQNSASEDETDQPEDPAVGTKRARIMPGSKIVLPSSNVEEYSGKILRDTISHIVNPKGLMVRDFYSSENCPSWWPKDVAFCILSGPKATMNGITAEHQKKVLAAFLEKCPEQYTISPRKQLLNPTSSPHVGDKQPVREVSPQSSSESSSESDQEEPVGMNQTPPTGANRTQSVGATISTAAQHASPKLILPSSCANDYSQPALILLIQKILNPLQLQGRKFTYFCANCPSWWPTDVPFINAEDMKSEIRRKVLTAFLEKCPDQYTISPPVDEQNSASTAETDQPEDPAVGTKRARMMPGSKIVLPSSNVEEYSGIILRGIISRILNPKGWVSRNIYASDNRPSWWPKDVAFTAPTGPKAIANGITTAPLRKVLAAFLEKCPEQYTISPPVDQQNSSSTVETDQPEYPAVGTKRPRIMPSSKIVLPSSDVYEYSGNILQSLMSCIANSKGWTGRNVYTSGNRPSWWPKDVAFASMTGRKSTGIVTAVHQRKVLAAFLEKCPEQYTISPGAWILNTTSSPLVGDKQPVREVVSPQSFSESDQEEPVGMNQTPPTGAYRTQSVGATISIAAQHASPKLILPSSCANDYSQPSLISLIRKILNPQRRHFIYSSANCPSWWPTDVPFIRTEDMEAKDRTKVLTAFLEKCPEQYTISPAVDQQNSASIVETDQPEDTIVDVQMNASESDAESDASITSDPEDLVNSLEQHLLDSRKRRLEAERKVEELTKEVKRLREERKFIGSIVKRSRLHH
ncbi:uncharacterized protein LOC135339482 isoform X3 [Halichondria panicea]